MSATFTPGPWSLVTTRKPNSQYHCWHEITAKGRNPTNASESAIAEVFEQETDGDFDPEGIANARLIAAAPDLLEALSIIVAEWDARCEPGESWPDDAMAVMNDAYKAEFIEKATAAIAKARAA